MRNGRGQHKEVCPKRGHRFGGGRSVLGNYSWLGSSDGQRGEPITALLAAFQKPSSPFPMATWSNKPTGFLGKEISHGNLCSVQVLFAAFLGEVHADATVTHLHGGSGAIPVCRPERRRAAHCPVRGDFRSARGLTSALPERPGSHPQGPLSTPGSSAPEGLTLAEMCWQLLPLKPVNHHLRREQGTWQNQKQFR